MKPETALVRALLPSRAAILASLVVLAGGARLLGLGTDWIGSDEQTMAILALELGVLPVFAAMLGGALVRGELAPWSWGLARPMSRARLGATSLILDAVTIGAALVLLSAILGDARSSLVADGSTEETRKFDFPHGIGVCLLVATAYLGTAVGAARGHATLRALPVGLAYAAASFCLCCELGWIDDAIARLFIIRSWASGEAGLVGGVSDEDAGAVASLFLASTIAVAITGGLAHGVLLALGKAPAVLPRREFLAVLALWAACATVTSWLLHSRLWMIADAPRLAENGDADLWLHGVDDFRVLQVSLSETDCATCFSRVTQPYGRGAHFRDVEPGRYRVCHRSPELRRNSVVGSLEQHRSRDARTPVFEHCVEVDLESGNNHLSLSFAPKHARLVSPNSSGVVRQHSSWAPLRDFSWVARTMASALRPLPAREPMQNVPRGAPRFASE